MNVVDHIGIHLMIAGTGTMHMAVLPAIKQAAVPGTLVALWLLTAAGIVYRLLFRHKASMRIVIVIYLAMAATALFAIDWRGPIWSTPMWFVYAAFGVYGFSAAFLFPRERLHAAWHLGVVAGYVLAGAPAVL